MDQVKVGKFIAELRMENNLTQKALVEMLGVSDKTISKWECGRGLPDIALIKPLCEQLNISINELLSGERLDEKTYREKAEQNIIVLVKEHGIKKATYHIVVSVLLFVFSFLSIILAAGKIITPIFMPMVFFADILFLIANLVAGMVYGMTRKWKKRILFGMLVLDLLLLVIMIVVFAMLMIIYSVV